MDTKETSVTRFMVKILVRYFIFAFLFVFFIFLVNQTLLMWKTISDNKTPIAQVLLLLFYSLPSIIAMTVPFAVCIGFVQGFIKIDIGDVISTVGKHGLVKKIIVPVFCLGFLFSIINFAFTDYILPDAQVSFGNLYRSILTNENIETGGSKERSPRELNTSGILKEITKLKKDGSIDNRKLNTYKLELHKKYAIPAGAIVFAFFAFILSIILKNHSKIGFGITLLFCVLHWALLMYGQIYAIKNGQFGILAMWFPNLVFLFITLVLYISIKIGNQPDNAS
ncbi:hypothetical protein AGMMS50267_14080 [Spirochaetia bacterium]|nr:hypothetical protein AGMMS50267_14080 [Spirochaetia bacterium]